MKKGYKRNVGSMAISKYNPGVFIPALFCFLFLLIFRYDYLKVSGQLSLFLNEFDFFRYYLERPGGILSYSGQFFSQFLSLPWLGSLLFSLLVVCLQFLLRRIFLPAGKIAFLSALLPFLLLASVANMGYMLFLNLHGGFFFVSVLGWIAVCLVYLLNETCISEKWYSLIPGSLAAALLVFAGGFYGILAFCILMLRTLFNSRAPGWLIVILSYILFFVFALLLGSFLLYPEYPWMSILYTHLKTYPWYFGKTALIPEIVFGVICIFAMIFPFNIKRKITRIIIQVAVMITVICVFSVSYIQNREINQYCRMLIPTWEKKWDKVLKLASGEKASAPLACLALAKENKLLDEMFRYIDPEDAYVNFFYKLNPQSDIANIEILQNIGLYYYAYHFAYENMVFRCPSIYSYRKLGYLSLINNEPGAAKKYWTTVSHTLLWKDEAKYYLTLLEETDKLNAEFEKERKLQPEYNHLGNALNGVENFMISNYTLSHRTPLTVQYAVASSLLIKKLDLLPVWVSHLKDQGFETVPAHMQEAFVLYYHQKKEQTEDEKKWVNSNMKVRFNEFLAIYASSKDMGEAKKRAQKFKGTYWYYYMFSPNVNFDNQDNSFSQ